MSGHHSDSGAATEERSGSDTSAGGSSGALVTPTIDGIVLFGLVVVGVFLLLVLL